MSQSTPTLSELSATITELQEGRRLVEQMVELAPDLVTIVDLATDQEVYANRNLPAYNTLPDEPYSVRVARLVHPDDRPIRSELTSKFTTLPDGGVVESEYRVVRQDGELRWLHSRETVFGRTGDGKPRLILGLTQDITENKTLLANLQASEQLLHRMIEGSPDCIQTMNLDGRLIYLNKAGAELLEIDNPHSFIGAEWISLWKEEFRMAAENALHVARDGEAKRFLGFSPTTKGTPRWWDVVVGPVLGPDGKPELLIAVSRDVTSLKTLEAERDDLERKAAEMANLDPVTGLLNSRAFHQQLERAAAQVAPGVETLTLIALDVTSFSFLTAEHGQSVGEATLVRIAETLRSFCRKEDVIARTGEARFGLMLLGLNRVEVGPFLSRLRSTIGAIDLPSPDASPGEHLHPTFAVGAAIYHDEAETVQEAFSMAEERAAMDESGLQDHPAEAIREAIRHNTPGFPLLDNLITAIDSRDRITRRQVNEATVHATRIAEALGVPADKKRSLQIAALLHDVGKIGIPETVLRISGELSEADFETMKQHPVLGAMLVGGILANEELVDAIYHHHENWDGSGYPSGLTGVSIPLLARILSVASSYAAMTNVRPYRKGRSNREAQETLRTGSGTQWDAHCVEALLDALQNS